MRLSVRTRQLLIGAAVTAALASNGFAQVQAKLQQIDGVPTEMKDLQSVYVRESGAAAEKLALAERMERLKEWDKAAGLYQEVIDKYPDRVVPTKSDETGQVAQYTSVAGFVQEQLAKWPEEGLTVYRNRFDGPANEMLERAGDDRAALERIVTQYFVTEAGKQAGLRLVGDGIERGEFATAAWIGRRLLAYHPSIVTERARLLFQTSIAEHLAGSHDASKQHLDELKTKFPAAVGTIRGKDVVLAEGLEHELKEQPSLVSVFMSDAWPLPYGNPANSAVPATASVGGARMFSTELLPLNIRGANPQMIKSYQQLTSRARNSGGMTGIFPSVDNGELFFQDNARVYAISLASGLPLSGWLQNYGGAKRGAYSIEAIPTPPGKPLGVCVTEKSVLAILGQLDMMAMNSGMGQQQGQPQLVNLDRATGKRLWVATLPKLKLPDELANLKEGQFYGTPMAVGDSVYCLVRANRGGQFEECHVMSLKLSDGSFQWAGYIASAASGNQFMGFDPESMGGSVTAQLAIADGRLYALTNLGAVACFDATGGKTLWINIYPREKTSTNPRFPMRVNNQQQNTKPYAVNPPMVADGKLFVAPTDAQGIFVYDAVSGDLLKKLPRKLKTSRKDRPEITVDMLLAVIGDKMVVGNKSTVMVFPWETYNPAKNVVENGGLFWMPTSMAQGNEDDVIRGRPFVTASNIFVPCADKLYRRSLASLKAEAVYPANGKWDDAEEAPGNVLATPDHLIVASHSRVTVYADLGLATAKLDDQIKANPTAVEPRLRYAELLFAGGKPADAMDWLDKAMAQMGGRDKLEHGPMRERLFEIANGFATKMARNDSAPPEVIRQLFARARDAADTPQQQVRYRMAHAALLRKEGDVAGEIALHQEILSNAEWRHTSVAGKKGSSTAAAEAEQSISELLATNKQAYAAIEKQAVERLAALQQQADAQPAAYVALADEFPLSSAAAPSLQKAAELYEQNQQVRESAQTLRRVLKTASTDDLRLKTLESLARTYSLMPNQIDLAVVRMQQAEKISGNATLTKPIKLPDGRVIENITLKEASELLRRQRIALAGKSLPKLGPLEAAEQQALQAVGEMKGVKLIVPQQPDATRNDRVVAFSSKGTLHQIAAGSAAGLHEPLRLPEEPMRCAYSDDKLIVISPEHVLAVDSRNGRLLWDMALASLPAAETNPDVPAPAGGSSEEDDIRAQIMIRQGMNGRVFLRNGQLAQVDASDETGDDAGGNEKIVQSKVLSDRVVFATTTGRVVSLELANGALAWQSRPAESTFKNFEAIDDFVVVASSDPMGTTDVLVLDGINGQLTERTTYSINQGRMPQQFVNMALSKDGVLVTMLHNQLVGRDLFETGNSSWKWPQSGRAMNEGGFQMSQGDDQLVINGDRVLALYTSNNVQTVRSYDLRKGKPTTVRDENNKKDIEVTYATTAAVTNQGVPQPISIKAVGSMCYVVGPKSLAAYDLERDGKWVAQANAEPGMTRDFVLTQDYALRLNQVAVVNPKATILPALKIVAFSRDKLPSGTESGVCVASPVIKDRIAAGNWQVADGSFYYVTADQKLKVMRPSGSSAPTTAPTAGGQ